jgi:hypothetical protein
MAYQRSQNYGLASCRFGMAKCPQCGGRFGIMPNGKLRRHVTYNTHSGSLLQRGKLCPGSGSTVIREDQQRLNVTEIL